MIQKAFDAIARADIDALVAHQVNESKTLGYKQELPGGSDSHKKEFLHDVSSFANASGGDIIYGIKAAVDDSGRKTGAPHSVQPISGTTADEAKLRLEEMVRTGIEPRLRVQIKEITGWGDDGEGFVILLRIPKSFASPHMVTFKGGSRFFSRNSAGKYQLDVHELRTSFLATESQAERIKRFREDRLGKIVADETPVTLSSPHRLVLHVIPIASFLNDERLDPSDYNKMLRLFPPIDGSVQSYRYNLDGFATFGSRYEGEDGHAGYCQMFSNGTIEAVSADFLDTGTMPGEQGDPQFIGSIAFERDLVEAVRTYLRAYKELGLDGPTAVSLALLGCRGAVMHVATHMMRRLRSRGHLHAIDRDTATLPDVVIDSLDVDVPAVMKPIFDAVWNACGYPGSLNYDESGAWNPR